MLQDHNTNNTFGKTGSIFGSTPTVHCWQPLLVCNIVIPIRPRYSSDLPGF